MVPGKFKVGGQSAGRMARVIEGMAKDFYKKVGDFVNQKFASAEINGILVGGPGPTKEDFVNGEFMWTDVKKKILAVKNIGYTGEFGLKELVERSDDVLEKEELMIETKLIQRFLTLMGTRKNFIAYGEEAVQKVVDINAVETLMISENFPEDKAEKFMDKVEEAGGDVFVISTETREGEQFAAIAYGHAGQRFRNRFEKRLKRVLRDELVGFERHRAVLAGGDFLLCLGHRRIGQVQERRIDQ